MPFIRLVLNHPSLHQLRSTDLIAEVKEALEQLMQLLRSTGVGALPVLPDVGPPGTTIPPPTEIQLLADANVTVNTLYDTLKRKQESAAVVANLLGADQRAAKA